ncbi:class I SAM-dependent methyltransferase [Acidiluteibacter ferrifornacis]|uniref:Methyltransferase domain-containing protein n=1 Tax=Acidiluteibacter ferrifornacis TaxID=2692424 RepID=A0A6N9NM55_9FLAO|nr:class I SAM-dependent methyltransferase [Acidiluteibacter ferrifornacis]NBG66310.1 methyltransferase domain-containing protein [Acidiluteibacter ferrifornacis]
MTTNYISINRDSWNKRTAVHVESEFYDIPNFLKGKNSLNSIELDLLGDVTGKKILHLQCHFGQDSISLARLGAKVTAVDLSDAAIDYGRTLNEQTKTDVTFICCDVYDLPNHLDEEFDIVFTSYGTIGWLPDINQWADIVAKCLKPGGEFIIAEFHPFIWMYDNDFKNIQFRYFNDAPIEETESGTYTNPDAELTQDYVSWNHGLGEVVNSLITKGLTIQSLQEFDYSPYNCFSNTVEFEPNKYRIKQWDNKVPMVYAIKAIKN